MREIEIGLNHGKGHICSAMKVFNIQHENISENRYEYWVTNCLFDFYLKIGKDSKKGRELKALIDRNVMRTDYNELFTSIILKYLVDKPDIFKKCLRTEKEMSYEEGRDSLKKDLRNLLK